MTHVRDIKAQAMAKEVRQHLEQHDGHLINCITKPLLSPENTLLLQKATQDTVTPRTGFIGHYSTGSGAAMAPHVEQKLT